jgi:hypothetical protein
MDEEPVLVGGAVMTGEQESGVLVGIVAMQMPAQLFVVG